MAKSQTAPAPRKKSAAKKVAKKKAAPPVEEPVVPVIEEPVTETASPMKERWLVIAAVLVTVCVLIPLACFLVRSSDKSALALEFTQTGNGMVSTTTQFAESPKCTVFCEGAELTAGVFASSTGVCINPEYPGIYTVLCQCSSAIYVGSFVHGEGPAPAPVPPPPQPSNVDSLLAQALAATVPDKSKLPRIADNFEAISARAVAGGFADVDAMFAELQSAQEETLGLRSEDASIDYALEAKWQGVLGVGGVLDTHYQRILGADESLENHAKALRIVAATMRTVK